MDDEVRTGDGTGRRRFLSGAGLALGVAGAAAVLPAGPAGASPGNFGMNLKDDFGAVGDGITDDTAAVQAAISTLDGSAAGPSAGITGGWLYVPSGEYRVTQTVSVHRFAGVIQGEGRGNLPTYANAANSRGKGAAFRWDGEADQPMFQVTDSAYVTFRDLMFLGDDDHPPSAGIDFHALSGAGSGTNALLLVEDCLFGVYPWTRAGVFVGHVKAGITFTGANANNDEFRIVRCQFEGTGSAATGPTYPDTHGIRIDNTQSIWGSIIDCRFNAVGTGLATASSTFVVNPQFNRCNRDFEVNSTAIVQVQSYRSEWTGQVAALSSTAGLHIDGGGCHLDHSRMGIDQADPASGGGKFIEAFPSGNAQSIVLRNIAFGRNDTTLAVLPTIRFGPQSPAAANGKGFHIHVDNCTGISRAQAEFAGTLWAVVPPSRGVIDWHSRHDSGIDQFRNVLRQGTGPGWRNTLDTTVWDPPYPGTL